MESFEDIILPSHANPIVIQWLKSGKAKIMPSGCWEWLRYKKPEGYGQLGYEGKIQYAHRVAIYLTGSNLCTLHSCDNPKCVNPSHLSAGTHLDNSRDKTSKGRGFRIGKKPRCACGRATAGESYQCQNCVSIRLEKFCYCGDAVYCNDLCSRHYSAKKPVNDARKPAFNPKDAGLLINPGAKQGFRLPEAIDPSGSRYHILDSDKLGEFLRKSWPQHLRQPES